MFSLKDIERHAVHPRVASVLANIKASIHLNIEVICCNDNYG